MILMREAWSALGGELSDLDRVKVEGDPAGLLPSRFTVLEMMIAAVGAATLAVSTFDAIRNTRTPRPQGASASGGSFAGKAGLETGEASATGDRATQREQQ